MQEKHSEKEILTAQHELDDHSFGDCSLDFR